MKNKHNLWRRIILAAVLLCLMLVGFFVYLYHTYNTTIRRNANYVADAASQTAKRIDDLLMSAENSIIAIAHMYEMSLDSTQADMKTLNELAEIFRPLQAVLFLAFSKKLHLSIREWGQRSDRRHGRFRNS